ncbi:MAG: hypothetical protein ABIO60_03515 [Aquaticitalea sp.]
MNRALLNFIATILLAVILSFFLPWWSVMIAAYVTALFLSLKHSFVFLVPFLAIFLFWAVYAFWLGNSNEFILSKKIAVLLPLGGNAWLLILVTGLIGGLAAGVSALFGKQCSLLVNRH